MDRTFQVCIIGSGVAGMAAAINAASEGLSTVIVEASPELGGQAKQSTRIENFPGFANGVGGAELTSFCVAQLKKFGSELYCPAKVVKVEDGEGLKKVHLEDGTIIKACTIIISVGLQYRLHEAKGLAYFLGHGVYYGCPASEYLLKGKRNLVIIGGANSAGQAALHLAQRNAHCTVNILIRGNSLEKRMSKYLVERIAKQGNIRVLTESTMTEVCGAVNVETIEIETKGVRQSFPANAVYIFIGAVPKTHFLNGTIQKDDNGFIYTGRYVEGWTLERQPFSYETSMPGVFAIGDVRHRSIKRVGAAVGEGCSVVADIHSYLKI